VLGSLAAAVSVDIGKGNSDTIQVRVFPKRTAQGPIAEGASLADTAIGSLTTKSITIQAYGDYDKVTEQALQFTSDDYKARLLNEMGAALNEKLEQVVYDVLKNANDTTSRTLDVAGVIDYEEVLKASAILKAAKCNPDFLIIHPDHEVDLLMDANLTKTVDYSPGQVALPGEIGRIGGVRILVHPLANAKSAAAGAINGILIDSSRAFGEAHGKPLQFYEDHVIESNLFKEVAWVWYGAAAIDLDAICHLKNA
jgi:N4-gp56 family major capsid protein